MAKAKPNALPEINISTGILAEKAKVLADVRSQIADLQTQEKDLREDMSDAAKVHRENRAEEDEFIGMIRVTGENVPPTRVEFRQSNKALAIDQEPLLDVMYGPSRPILFSKEKQVTALTDPSQVIQDLVGKGFNPWDCLEIRVKSGMDRTVSDATEHVTVAEGLVPQKGFIARIAEIKGTLTERALEYTKKYLEQTLTTVVVAGTKGKA